MDRYIGLDVHQTGTTLAIVGPSGRRLGSQVLDTNAQALIEAIRPIPKPRLPRSALPLDLFRFGKLRGVLLTDAETAGNAA